MPRIPYPDITQLPEVTQKTLAMRAAQCRAHLCRMPRRTCSKRRGSSAAPSPHPEALEPRLRETVILRVAYLSNSDYELHHHVPLGRAAA